MKKQHLALASLCVLASTAHAQSSVTLYGIIDQGFNINTNSGGKQLYNLSSGVMQGSRWGVRGAEDLGGGMKAIFVLENGFDINTGALGQGGLMFGRQAYVGLKSDKYGSVTLGRQYDAVVDNVGPLEAGTQWGGYIAAHPGDLDNLNNTYRANSAIKYTSANYAGLTVEGMYALGGTAGDVTHNQIWSLGANYANGPLVLGVGYLNARTPSASGGMLNNSGTIATGATTATLAVNPAKYPVYSGYQSANTWQVITAGGAYTLGSATLGLVYSNVSFRNLDSVNQTALPNLYRRGENATFNNIEVSGKYQFTPALLAGAAFNYTDGGSVDYAAGGSNQGAKYFQYSLGADYFLSKRTDVYVIGVYQHASGTDSTGHAAVASINLLSASTTDNQATVRFGIRHKF